MNFKKRLDERGFLVGGDYNILYQGISESLTDNKDALGQVFRVQGEWNLFGEEDVSEGSLIFKGENRSRMGTAIAPRDLGSESGYLGSPGIVFSDVDWFLANLYWQQAIAGRMGIVIGRMEPDSFVDVSGYASPWPGFKNAGVLVNNTVPFPALGLGAASGITFNDQWVVKGGLYDANGDPKSYTPFSAGGEFFTHLELSWAPSRAERFNKEIHITAWHVDRRQQAGTPESHGIVLSGTWTFDEVWMPFFRAGWAEGGAPLMRRGVLAGVLKYFPCRGDLAGIGFSWEDPSDRTLREQKTMELFYNYRVSRSLWVAPSLQVFVDPATNPNDNVLTLIGCNVRITY
jgi:porin